jgi:hypothetical protein
MHFFENMKGWQLVYEDGPDSSVGIALGYGLELYIHSPNTPSWRGA